MLRVRVKLQIAATQRHNAEPQQAIHPLPLRIHHLCTNHLMLEPRLQDDIKRLQHPQQQQLALSSL